MVSLCQTTRRHIQEDNNCLLHLFAGFQVLSVVRMILVYGNMGEYKLFHATVPYRGKTSDSLYFHESFPSESTISPAEL
jgi:hypothetical protein